MAFVLADTSALYALADGGDANHSAAKATLIALKRRRAEPLLTNFIVAETHALLLHHPRDPLLRWGRELV